MPSPIAVARSWLVLAAGFGMWQLASIGNAFVRFTGASTVVTGCPPSPEPPGEGEDDAVVTVEHPVPPVLYHYTSEKGLAGILSCQCIFASYGKNARWGVGVYFTDLSPAVAATTNPWRLSYALNKFPWKDYKVTHFVAVDTGKMEPLAIWKAPLFGSRFVGSIFLSPGPEGVTLLDGAIVGAGEVPF